MQILLVLHNLFRWLILIFAFWAIISAISGLASKRVYSLNDGRSNFFFMLSMDIQLLLGLALYFITVEYSVIMIIAWILVHVGRVAVKKAVTSPGKYKRTLLYFGISLLLILISIPWPFREIARPWIR